MVTQDAQTTTTSVQPTIGDDIFTSDGKLLGAVKEAAPDHFKVDVRWARDFWLSTETVRFHVPGCVTLAITREDINAWKLRRPGEQLDSALDPGDDSLLSEDRKRAMRDGIERTIGRQQNRHN